MRRFIFILFIIYPLAGFSQAHLGATEEWIKEQHPLNEWKEGYTTDGYKYIQTDMSLGTYIYYFDNTTNATNIVTQIPSSLVNLNTQVQIYNGKYTITSSKSWTAYLDGGGIMYITLKYDSDYQSYIFYYTNAPIPDDN